MTLRTALACALIALPGALAAETYPWEGAWVVEPAECDGDRTVYTPEEFVTAMHSCNVTAITALPGLSAWRLDIQCGEGTPVFDASRILMLTDRAGPMWEWYGPGKGAPLQVQRCADYS
ncbi:MAG: hypothetical protein GC146_03485 [Limimaricola sp.]|uniref:hypothetical protein n=1 Tax=Limimaricola sp. TaxID=2211665 RepID=UPI001D6DC198|nr:hypothetical protein [Limimaricola sp.]MBI1416263.1 hypothetical protein [Limimaricola sp.]